MIEFSRSLSRHVFDDGIRAYNEVDHPCHPFVRWQQSYAIAQGRADLTFQMPEPFSGERSDLNLVFVGLNPSFDPWEEFPTPADSFESYDAFFRCRFDDEHRNAAGQPVVFDGGPFGERTSRPPTFWRGIERFGNRYLAGELGGSFRLGTDAILTQVVRYKSRDGWMGDNSRDGAAIWRHEAALTRYIIDDLKPDVAVPCGGKALHGLARALNLSQLEELGIGEAIGCAYEAELPCGKVMRICPARHHSRPAPHEQWEATARAILESLDRH
jgi:hypothetical protein